MLSYNEIISEVKKILDQYEEPLTLRQIYYRLVAKQIISNTRQSYKTLGQFLVRARENGDIPYERMEDRNRDTIGGDSGYDSPEDADKYIKGKIYSLKSSSSGFSLSRWKDQNYHVELWIEKDALRRVLSDVAGMYNVKTCICRGYPSFSFLMDAVKRFSKTKPNIVLYFGDFDPTGLDIVRDLEERLLKYSGKKVVVKRVALTKDQIKNFNLPYAPTKKTDARTKKFVKEYGNMAVELDALEPDVLKDIAKKEILNYIDAKKWNTRAKKEQEARLYIQKKVNKLLEKLKDMDLD